MELKLTSVSKDFTTGFECDCCGKLLPANKMVWGIDNLDCSHCYGKSCFKKLTISKEIEIVKEF